MEIPLRHKYRVAKPRGSQKSRYGGNSGRGRGKHIQHPAIHGIRRKKGRNPVVAFNQKSR